MMRHKALFGAAAAVALGLATSAQAFPLYFENFDLDHTANWSFNSSVVGDTATNGVNNEANFFFDYSTVGIPSAMHCSALSPHLPRLHSSSGRGMMPT